MSELVENVEDEIEESGDRPKLPNMNEFSPGSLGTSSIKQVLSIIYAHQKDKDAAVAAIVAACPKIAATFSPTERKKRAANVLIGMSQCGLLKTEGRRISAAFTPIAQEIHDQPTDAASSDRFARHLLENCHGLELLDVIAVIRARAEEISLDSIRDELRARGFAVTENEGASSKLRKWLEPTGLINEEWEIDDSRLHAVAGATHETLGKWASLTIPQRLFAEALRRITLDDHKEWVPVRQIKRICEAQRGRKIFPEGHLRQAVIDPLAAAGWIEAMGSGPGRGGDSGQVKGTPQLSDPKIKLPVDLVSGIPVDLRDKLSVPREQVLADLTSEDTYVKGIALELLALRLCRDVGLFPVGFRERSNKTQGAEVDLIANGVHLHYSRWLIQCKNTARVEMKDLAKEIGMAVLLKAHVIVLVTTGRFARTVIDGANGLANTSALQAVLMDGRLLESYRTKGGSAVSEWLSTSAFQALSIKRNQIHEIEE